MTERNDHNILDRRFSALLAVGTLGCFAMTVTTIWHDERNVSWLLWLALWYSLAVIALSLFGGYGDLWHRLKFAICSCVIPLAIGMMMTGLYWMILGLRWTDWVVLFVLISGVLSSWSTCMVNAWCYFDWEDTLP